MKCTFPVYYHVLNPLVYLVDVILGRKMCFSCISGRLFKGGFVPLPSVWTEMFVP